MPRVLIKFTKSKSKYKAMVKCEDITYVVGFFQESETAYEMCNEFLQKNDLKINRIISSI